jgi:hypothetical protein
MVVARRGSRRMVEEGRAHMALIKSSVDQLPYRLVDFDQHCYEADYVCVPRQGLPGEEAGVGGMPSSSRRP